MRKKTPHKWKILFSVILILFSFASIILYLGYSYAGHVNVNVFNTLHWRIFTAIIIASLVVINIVEFVSPFIVSEANFNTAIMAASILIYYIFSSDGIMMMEGFFSFAAPSGFIYVSKLISTYAYCFFLTGFYLFGRSDFPVAIHKRESLASLIILLVCALLYPLLLYFHLPIVAFVPMFLLNVYWGFRFFIGIVDSNKLTPIYVFAFAITVFINGMELAKNIVLTFFGRIFDYGVPSICAVIIVILFFSVYLYFTFRISKEATSSMKKQKQIDELMSSVLTNQMNPHYVFNSLHIIKSLYAQSLEQGDEAIDLFASYLRSYTSFGKKELISFNEELGIIESYVRLENMKKNNPFNLIYNVEATSFFVPPFAIETLIENAIRYSKVNEKEDGYIELSSSEDDHRFIIEIIDNGIGFDPNLMIKENSLGIANSKQRFALLLGATFDMESSENNGTHISIFIPKEKPAKNLRGKIFKAKKAS